MDGRAPRTTADLEEDGPFSAPGRLALMPAAVDFALPDRYLLVPAIGGAYRVLVRGNELPDTSAPTPDVIFLFPACGACPRRSLDCERGTRCQSSRTWILEDHLVAMAAHHEFGGFFTAPEIAAIFDTHQEEFAAWGIGICDLTGAFRSRRLLVGDVAEALPVFHRAVTALHGVIPAGAP